MPNRRFFFSTEALVISVATASTSAISSMLVIFIILRSQSRLSKTYHIIMFFMSFWDFISSTATALVTLPMPSDVHDVYPFSGYAIGTSRTCAAQSFSIVAGQGFTICSIVALNLYYVITIRYGVSDYVLKKKMLPIALAGSIIIVFLPIVIFPLYLDLFNPRPYEPYCLVGQYPEQCKLNGIECIGGDVSTKTFIIWWWITIIGIGSGFFLVFVSLVLVIMSIFHTERAIKKNARQKVEDESLDQNSIQSTSSIDYHLEGGYEMTRRALRISLLYIGAFFLTWIWTILTMAVDYADHRTAEKIVDMGKLVFNPLQGFFNASIFIYDKVRMVRSSNENLTFTTALTTVLFHPEDLPEVVLSSIEIVTQDLDARERYERDAEIQRNATEHLESFEIVSSSIPSDFKSLQTPSFALSNAVSSQGVDREVEKKTYDYSKQSRFYSDLPSDYLAELFNIDIGGPSHPVETDALPKTIKNSSPIAPTIDDTGKCKQKSTGVKNISLGTDGVAAPGAPDICLRQVAREGIDERSHFSLNSLLSGFSSILTPTSRWGRKNTDSTSSLQRETDKKQVDFVDNDLSFCSRST